jgi:hypothetical protein
MFNDKISSAIHKVFCFVELKLKNQLSDPMPKDLQTSTQKRMFQEFFLPYRPLVLYQDIAIKHKTSVTAQ